MVAFTATDAAGNQSTTSVSLRIDSVAPVVTPGDHGAAAANRDPQRRHGRRDRRRSRSRCRRPRRSRPRSPARTAPRVRTLCHDRDRRRLRQPGTAGPRPASPCPTAGTRSRSAPATPPATSAIPVAAEVDVYAALASLTRTPAQFYPQDGDTLARRGDGHLPAAVARPPSPSRSSMRPGPWCAPRYARRRCRPGRSTGPGTARSTAGPRRRAAPTGSSSRRPTAPSGPPSRPRCSPTRSASGRRWPTRCADKPSTITARSTEPLSTSPVVVVREPGVCRRGRSR